MGLSEFDLPEEEMKKWLNHIALICLSEEFQSLKQELEVIYLRSNVDNAGLVAFQDALYSFLAQEEDEQACQSQAF